MGRSFRRGLVCGQLLIGIIIRDEDEFGGERLTAIPVHSFIADAGFRGHLISAGHSLRIDSVEFTSLLASPPHPPRKSPATLLRADLEVVRFRRRAELRPLLSWCVNPDLDVLGVRLLTGTGGLGKTRLARELVSIMEGSGWVAGFLLPDRPGREADLTVLTATDMPVLLVVDYAETRMPQVARLLTTVWDASDLAPVRLLLLARTSGNWWKRLRLEYPDPLMTAAVTSLAALDTSSQDRTNAWQEALTAFADHLPEVDPDPATDWSSLPRSIIQPPNLLDEEYGSPLNLQVAALTALLQAGPHPLPEPDDRPREDVLLDHERRYWQRTAADRQLNCQDTTLELAIGTATFLGASNEQEAVDTLACIPQLQGQSPDTMLALARWIADLYPATPGQYWGTLQPDPLAEHHIRTVIWSGDSGLLETLLTSGTFDQKVHGLLRLFRARQASEMSRAGLREILRGRRTELEEAAVTASMLAGTDAETYVSNVRDTVAAMSHDDRNRIYNQMLEEPGFSM